MGRRVVVVFGLLLMSALSASVGSARAAGGYSESFCQARPQLCVDPYKSVWANGEYTGHDEPATEFLSNRPGTGGKDLSYTLILPKNPPVRPNQAGTRGTWDFQLRATFWLSIAMCDSQSSPNYTHSCKPNSDYNAKFKSLDPSSRFYIGKHPGNALMELQFYEPGWVPQFDGFGCTATKWCANLTIDSLSSQDNTGVQQNADCLNNHFLVGQEPINWAYITRSGRSQAPANPLALSNDPNLTGLTPDPSKDLLMNGGDKLRIHMHDTHAGYRIDIWDISTGQHGSMTASIANGFGHVLFQPHAKRCHVAPYAFHPEYSSAVARGTTWAAHNSNVSFSDEIGHFEYCNATDPATFACTKPGGTDKKLDADDQFCLNGANYPGALDIIGCLLDDGDFDGPSYLRDWPGTFSPQFDTSLHPTPVRFTVPTSNGTPLERVSFETDLPRIERGEPAGHVPACDGLTGAHCVNPPPGARFYPIFTAAHVNGLCMLQQGGSHIPGTFRDFGGNSKSEYGHLVFNTYPDTGFTTIRLAEVFRRDLHRNPCAHQ